MNLLHCSRCDNDIPIPNLSSDQTTALLLLYRAGKPLSVVDYLRKTCGLGLADAKNALDHMTPLQDKCHRCNYSLLPEGASVCPKCKSVNLNWRG